MSYCKTCKRKYSLREFPKASPVDYTQLCGCGMLVVYKNRSYRFVSAQEYRKTHVSIPNRYRKGGWRL